MDIQRHPRLRAMIVEVVGEMKRVLWYYANKDKFDNVFVRRIASSEFNINPINKD
jgi:hypothetical protein